eukprot:scaffold1130_cov121-Skeletonema_dohrnii-CCMP3373.AAC.3
MHAQGGVARRMSDAFELVPSSSLAACVDSIQSFSRTSAVELNHSSIGGAAKREGVERVAPQSWLIRPQGSYH